MDHEEELRAFMDGKGRTRSQRVALWVMLALVVLSFAGIAARAIAG